MKLLLFRGTSLVAISVIAICISIARGDLAYSQESIPGGAGTIGNASGGASIANYNDLIQLIQQTVDAEWAVNGGTANLMPFPNGVRISTKGVIERFDPTSLRHGNLRIPKTVDVSALKQRSKEAIASLDQDGSWQDAASLRWVSLHQLDKAISERLSSKQSSNAAMELLAGLVRIDYVAYDSQCQEWFLGGPAGQIVLNDHQQLVHQELALPPVLLEDLLSIAPHVLNNQGDLGCTIEPDPSRLLETHQAIQKESELRKLQKDPKDWEQQWKNRIGNQEARVIGLPQSSPTGYAMLVADAQMKRVAFGLESRPFKMKSYWDEVDFLQPKSERMGIVRWWFSLSENAIPMDPKRKIYHLKYSNVRVLSEAQMMNEMGRRSKADQPDLAADAFARSFTRWFESLQQSDPIYGRLRHQFDLAVAMEIVRNEQLAGNGKPFLAINESSVQPRMKVAPKEIESIAATHKTSSGRMIAIVSGGVSIDLQGLGKRLTVDTTETNQVSVERSPGESASGKTTSFWR